MSQSTEKSLGQVAHETGERVGRWARRWSDVGPAQQDEWEQIAQAVAAVVRAQQAQEIEALRAQVQDQALFRPAAPGVKAGDLYDESRYSIQA